jgi:hypothetical protein
VTEQYFPLYWIVTTTIIEGKNGLLRANTLRSSSACVAHTLGKPLRCFDNLFTRTLHKHREESRVNEHEHGCAKVERKEQKDQKVDQPFAHVNGDRYFSALSIGDCRARRDQ